MGFDFKIFGIRFLIVDIYKFKNLDNLIVSDKESCVIREQNVIDIKEWQGEKLVKIFCSFLQQNNVGLYVYRDEKVVARAWAFLMNHKSKLYHYSFHDALPVRIGYVEVRKSYRGMGISRVLLNDLIVNCFSLGLKSLYIDISSNNIRMQKLVSRCGFNYCASSFVIQVRHRNLIEIKLNKTIL